ncbi:MAG TPA: glycerophosphodiester phosphodiesterase [Gemmatimonadaceae bacterium]|nr:glycerophosphodiester phosphodiesterase [Gemmatimonadaceae bacterium]
MNILLDAGAHPVIGHRGARAHAPENTIESFAQAVAAGAEAIEFDIRLSADGVPGVFHDPQVSRTTDGTGEVKRMTFAELRELDAGARFTPDGGKTYPYAGMGHRIPSLEEVIEAFPSTPVLIEVKDPLTSTVALSVIESHAAGSRCLVDSVHSAALKTFANAGVAVGSSRNGVVRLVREVLTNRPPSGVNYQALCVPLNYYGLPVPVRAFARVMPSLGCRIHVWTINDPAVAEDLWLCGVNGIISDDPGLMLKLRQRLFPPT